MSSAFESHQTQRERAMRFVFWAQKLHGEMPTYEQVMEHFGVSRATAYRFLADYRAALDLPDPTPADQFKALQEGARRYREQQQERASA